jgi:arylsulfatase A-like enzyme
MNIKSKSLSCVVLATLSMSVGCQTNPKKIEKSSNRPNVVVIYLDDLGYGDVSCYGGVGLKTPNIDALAKDGVRFTNGYATSATCTPSRYGLLTGVYPWRNKDAKFFRELLLC